MIQAKRFDTTVAHLDTLTELLRGVLLTRSIEVAVKESFPWTGALPADGREEFFTEFVNTFRMCQALDVWAPLDQMLVEWKATAASYADPDLHAHLRRPMAVDEDLGVVPPPEVPDAEAG